MSACEWPDQRRCVPNPYVFNRSELIVLANACGVPTRRAPPGRGQKTMPELCADITQHIERVAEHIPGLAAAIEQAERERRQQQEQEEQQGRQREEEEQQERMRRQREEEEQQERLRQLEMEREEEEQQERLRRQREEEERKDRQRERQHREEMEERNRIRRFLNLYHSMSDDAQRRGGQALQNMYLMVAQKQSLLDLQTRVSRATTANADAQREVRALGSEHEQVERRVNDTARTFIFYRARIDALNMTIRELIAANLNLLDEEPAAAAGNVTLEQFKQGLNRSLASIMRRREQSASERSRQAAAEEKKREEQQAIVGGPHCVAGQDMIMLEDLVYGQQYDDDTLITIVTDPTQPDKRQCFLRNQLKESMETASKLYEYPMRELDDLRREQERIRDMRARGDLTGDEEQLRLNALKYDHLNDEVQQIYQLPLGNFKITREGFINLLNPEHTAYMLVEEPGVHLISAKEHTVSAVWNVTDYKLYTVVPLPL